MLIAIEGMDASGKATQSRLLARKLGGAAMAFPNYETEVGQAILANLKGEWSAGDELNALVFQSLFTLNRLEMIDSMKAAMAAGPLVLDRYYASGIVYGALDGLDARWLERIHQTLPAPDRWVFIDVPPEESERRRPERRDRYEMQPGLMARVRDGYRDLFTARGWAIVDGVGSVDEVHARVWAAVQ